MKSNKDNLKVIFNAAVSAADPYRCVTRHLADVRNTYERGGFESLFVVAFGKAAFPMCRAVEEGLGDIIIGGVAITKYDHGGKLKRIRMFEAAHPVPDANGVRATRELMDLLRKGDEKTLVLCLISGGGSALLVSPCEGISLEDKQKTTGLLLSSGADIMDMNCVRKHLSAVKGGRLAEAARPATVISLILSDVIGDPLDVIASGPTAPDPTTFTDALTVIRRQRVTEMTPPSVMNILTSGRIGSIKDTPKAGSDVFARVRNLIIGNNRLALDMAKRKAEELGYSTEITSAKVEGEAGEVARSMAEFAIRNKKKASDGPHCFISGGETTVAVKGEGMGGRNMELSLVFAEKIRGVEDVTLLSAGTDGTDGPTDAAGAIVDGSTVPEAEAAGLNAGKYLENNDSYRFFKKAGGLLVTGPTGTNVMDVQILIVG